MGVAYVRFSRERNALYRLMGDCSRDHAHLKMMEDHDGETGFTAVRATIKAEAGPGVTDLDLELASIAAWCAAHGLSEIANYRQFDHLKEELGGEDAFARAVLEHVGMFKLHG